MEQYRVGDRVALRSDLVDGETYGGITYYDWFKLKGKVLTIEGVENRLDLFTFEESRYLSTEMIDPRTLWVARDRDETLWLYADKPEKKKSVGSWLVTSVEEVDCELFYDGQGFEDVKWEDEEPTRVPFIDRFTDALFFNKEPMNVGITAEEAIKHSVEKFLTEENTPITEHRAMQDRLHEMYKEKNGKYGNSFKETHERFGALASFARLFDKMKRMEQLLTSEEGNDTDESIVDTAMDLSNYAAMFAIEMEREAEWK